MALPKYLEHLEYSEGTVQRRVYDLSVNADKRFAERMNFLEKGQERG